jgi:hypothetical protein
VDTRKTDRAAGSRDPRRVCVTQNDDGHERLSASRCGSAVLLINKDRANSEFWFVLAPFSAARALISPHAIELTSPFTGFTLLRSILALHWHPVLIGH